jgi:hypothetical protein
VEVVVIDYFWVPTTDYRHAVRGTTRDYHQGQQTGALCGTELAVRVPPAGPDWYIPTCQGCHDAALKLPERYTIPYRVVAR